MDRSVPVWHPAGFQRRIIGAVRVVQVRIILCQEACEAIRYILGQLLLVFVQTEVTADQPLIVQLVEELKRILKPGSRVG